MNKSKQIRETFEKNNGVFRLIPVFVPRRFGQAGRQTAPASARLLRAGHGAGLDQGALVLLGHPGHERRPGGRRTKA